MAHFKIDNNTTRHAAEAGNRRASSAGFTLTELLIAVFMMTLIVAAILSTFSAVTRNFKAASNYGMIHREGRKVVDLFAKDFRAASDVTNWSTNSITLVVPISFNSSGAITNSKTYTYELVGRHVNRCDADLWPKKTRIADDVDTLTFTLYDRVGQSTSLTTICKGCQLDIKLRDSVMSMQETEDYLSGRLVMRNKP